MKEKIFLNKIYEFIFTLNVFLNLSSFLNFPSVTLLIHLKFSENIFSKQIILNIYKISFSNKLTDYK